VIYIDKGKGQRKINKTVDKRVPHLHDSGGLWIKLGFDDKMCDLTAELIFHREKCS